MESCQALMSEDQPAMDSSLAGVDWVPGDHPLAPTTQPFGALSIGLSIGPLSLRIEGLATEQAKELQERFHPFVKDCHGPVDVAIGLRKAGIDRFLTPRRDGSIEVHRLVSRLVGTRLELWSYEFSGWVETRIGLAALSLVASSGPLFHRGVENFLRALTASFILEREGLLLHGAAVVRKGKAYVFFGPSGSGKTTVTDLSPGDTILSDDLTLVVKSRDGYQAAGIPFGMAHHRVPNTCASFPIASFNRLVQRRSVDRHPLKGARASAEIAASLPFVMQDPRQARKALETVSQVLAEVPAFRLEFRRDDAFWRVIEET